MRCLKCGREIQGNEKDVFCPDCLKVMEAFPVKPGVHVQIPTRQAAPRRAQTRSVSKPEEVTAGLRRRLRFYRITLAVVLAVFLITTGVLSVLLYQAYTAPVIGSNYSTVSTDPTTP